MATKKGTSENHEDDANEAPKSDSGAGGKFRWGEELALVGGPLVLLTFMRDWSHHLIDELAEARADAGYVAGLDAVFVWGFVLCFFASGVGALFVTGYPWIVLLEEAAPTLASDGDPSWACRVARRVACLFRRTKYVKDDRAWLLAGFMGWTAVVCFFAWFVVASQRLWPVFDLFERLQR